MEPTSFAYWRHVVRLYFQIRPCRFEHTRQEQEPWLNFHRWHRTAGDPSCPHERQKVKTFQKNLCIIYLKRRKWHWFSISWFTPYVAETVRAKRSWNQEPLASSRCFTWMAGAQAGGLSLSQPLAGSWTTTEAAGTWTSSCVGCQHHSFTSYASAQRGWHWVLTDQTKNHNESLMRMFHVLKWKLNGYLLSTEREWLDVPGQILSVSYPSSQYPNPFTEA